MASTHAELTGLKVQETAAVNIPQLAPTALLEDERRGVPRLRHHPLITYQPAHGLPYP
jgi:hypothetical protein